jgi:hypothetical protein
MTLWDNGSDKTLLGVCLRFPHMLAGARQTRVPHQCLVWLKLFRPDQAFGDITKPDLPNAA